MKQIIKDIYWRKIEDSSIFDNKEIDCISLNFYTNVCVFKLSNITIQKDVDLNGCTTYISPFCNYNYNRIANNWSFIIPHPTTEDAYIKVFVVITPLHPNGVIYTEPFEDEIPIGFKECCKRFHALY